MDDTLDGDGPGVRGMLRAAKCFFFEVRSMDLEGERGGEPGEPKCTADGAETDRCGLKNAVVWSCFGVPKTSLDRVSQVRATTIGDEAVRPALRARKLASMGLDVGVTRGE